MKVDTSSIRETKRKLKRQRIEKLTKLLDEVGERTVGHLVTFTGERNDRGFRLHPGGWATRTGELASRFFYEVEVSGDRVRLTIGNDAPHAHLVEAVSGMFVVRGVADPGGPVQQALLQAAREMGLEVV